VLSNGENIEPSPIEDAMLGCKFIDQVVLAGQDKKRLSAIAVLNPQELYNAGFIDHDEGERLQSLVDIINNPQCSKDEYAQSSTELSKVSEKLKSDTKLLALVNENVKHLLKRFRPWEQVGRFKLTLEPVSIGPYCSPLVLLLISV